MTATVHRTHESLLPAGDTHPYRTGAWRPQLREWDDDDLLCVAGTLPADLDGLYVRNTENPLVPAFERYHPFDGDGMLHAIRFAGGKARYRNRFVPTKALAQELAAGGPLYAGITEDPRRSQHPGWGARGGLKDASSTDVIVHRGRVLSTYYQCGDAYAFTDTLTALGPEPWVPQDTGISAHPKVCERTGELHYFRYSKTAPYMHVGVVDARGERVHDVPVALPGPRLPHDMALGERHVVLNDFPIFWDPDLLARGVHRPRYDPRMPSRFAVLPRRGRADEVKWFEASATYVLHFPNVFEDGDDLVLDGYAQADPMPRPQPELHGEYAWLMRQIDIASLRPTLRRWRMNLVTGACREENLTATFSEFPTINPRFAGKRHHHVWSMTAPPGWFMFDGILHTDLETGRETIFKYDPGVYASEVAVVPRGDAEHDAWIVTLVMDTVRDLSECHVFDARDLTAGPVARLRLPERVASGTHATWASGAHLRAHA